MKSTVLPGLYYWGAYQPDRRIDFNGWFWERGGGNLAIDPMPLDGAGMDLLRERGGLRWILVNNAEHWRASGELAERTGAEILAHRAERGRLGERAGEVSAWFEGTDSLPAELRDDVEVFGLEGGKSPIEPCFHLRPLAALYFGDLVRSHVSGELCLLPEPKLSDRGAAVASLQKLGHVSPRALLLGDGDPLLSGAGAVFHSWLASLVEASR